MKFKTNLIMAAAMASLTVGANATTLLFLDNFNDDPNSVNSTFNNNLGSTQSGTLATIAYNLNSGGDFTNQHSNGGNLLVANFNNDTSRITLNNNFATQANATNQALVFGFQLRTVFGYADPTNWGGFTVGTNTNPFVNSGGGAAILFRQNGGTETFNAGTAVANTATWAANDFVTITLSGTGGVGSAFNGNGSVANVMVGATNVGTFTLAQQTDAYITIGLANTGDNPSAFGIDNLSVTAIPEPSTALLGGLGLVALLRRRR